MSIRNIFSGMLFAIAFLIIANVQLAYSQEYCTASTSIEDEYISRVEFGDIDQESDWQNGVADYTDQSTDMKVGEDYNIKVTNGNAWDSDRVSVWIDWNQNNTFDSGEIFNLTTSDGAETFTGTLKIPDDGTAVAGTTRMRVRMTYSSQPTPCGTSSFGEVEDYSVNIKLPIVDAGISEIVTPPAPVPLGTHEISAVIKSYNEDVVLENCVVHWSFAGEYQGSHNWSGSLEYNETDEIVLGEISIEYPEDGPFNPFMIQAWTTNPNGFADDEEDGNPDNDLSTKYVAPPLDDAGVIGFTSPSGTIEPGVYEIWAEIKNFAPKPLTFVTIEWSVDGIEQESVNWFGKLGAQASTEVLLGEYEITIKTPLEAFVFEANTKNPNQKDDEVKANDATTANIGPSLVSGVYTVGGSAATFPDFTSAVAYLNGSGIATDGTVEFIVNPGTYNGALNFDDFTYQNNNFIFRSSTGNPGDVTVRATPTQADNYVARVNNIHNIKFEGITFEAVNATTYGGVFHLVDVDGFTMENCALVGARNTGNPARFVVFESNNSNDLHFSKSSFNYGSGSMLINSAVEPMLKVDMCDFTDFEAFGVINNYFGMYGEGINVHFHSNNFTAGAQQTPNEGLKTVVGAMINDNVFSGLGGTASQGGYAIAVIGHGEGVNTIIEDNRILNSRNISGIFAEGATQASIRNNSININNTLQGNNIAGIKGMGLLIQGEVKKDKKQNSHTALSNQAVTISGNTITSSGAPGLSLEDMNYEVFRNKVDVTANQAWGIGAVETNDASGYLAVNMISGLGAHGIKAINNDGLASIYNSIMADINGGYAIFMQGGNNIVWRNIFVNNNGNGRVVGTVSVTSVSLNMDENNLFTKGTEIGSYNGQVAATLANWQQLSSKDGNSSNTDPGFTTTELMLSRFDPTLLVYYPIPLDLTAEQRNNFENQDWDGDIRENQGAYYFGVDNIQPQVIIDAHPTEVIGCIGSTNMNFGISAYVTLGAETQYQWYKDGMPIPGATQTILELGALDYSMSGLYWCVVSGTGGATPIVSERAALYTLTSPEIDDQPETAMAEVGGTATFTVSAHVRHLPPNWNYDYQWYFFDGTNTITLQDNNRIEGARSSQLTIRNITSADYNTNTYYTVKVIGKCGEVTSTQARIEEAVYEDYGLEITEQPMFASVVCPGADIEMSVEGQPLGTSTDLTYQWFKNGAALMDGDNVFGSASNSLRIAEATADDAGTYWVVLTELPGNNTLKSVEVPIAFAPETAINDFTYPETVNPGAMFEVTWDVEGAEPLEVVLYLEGEIINISTEKVGSWVVAEADETNTGNFDIEVTAACGEPVLDIFAVILEDGGTPSSVPTALGINMLYDPMPNPVSNFANIYFEMNEPGSAKLELMNQSGQTIATLVDEYRAAGLQNIEINADQLRLSSGMYYLVLRTGRYVGYSKLSIVK